MLSFTSGERKLALIKGGKYNNKILKLSDGKENKNTEYSDSDSSDEEYDYDYPTDYIDETFYQKELKGRLTREKKQSMIEPLRHAITQKSKKGLPKELYKVYQKALQGVKDSMKKDVKINDGVLFPLPQKFESGSEHGYVAGPSGSGKSHYVGNYIEMFKKQHKNAQVWLFSRVDDDKALDKHNIKRIALDDGLLEDPINPAELSEGKPTLVIFDDVDTIRDKDIRAEVLRLRDDILETGRHENITSISTNHLIMDYKKTRTLLNEVKFVTIFPQSGTSYHIKRLLKEYVGLDKNIIQRIMALPSRWVTVYKVAPMLVMYERGCFLIT